MFSSAHFVARNGEQRQDQYACPPEIRGGDGIAFQGGAGRWQDNQGVNRAEEEENRHFQKKVMA